MPDLSVIICTHNPRPDYLRRVLDALKAQTLPQERWELLLIDNASLEPLAGGWDLSWHPAARHVREPELGLTPARLCGIRNSRGEVLVFVDDDNVLAPDYLERAVEVATTFAFLGAWGGNVIGEYEAPPPAELTSFLPLLAIRSVTRDVWANLPAVREAEPCGAGMCVRRLVAQEYERQLRAEPERRLLDRKGKELISGGDADIAYTACDMNLAMGLFARLYLTHLIPQRRLTAEYLLKLIEGVACSDTLNVERRTRQKRPSSNRFVELARFAYLSMRLRGFQRRSFWAYRAGIRRAQQLLNERTPTNGQTASVRADAGALNS